MARIKNRSSLLSKYSLLYEKNPRSRVFAPLAETYRKLGMLDEAMQILKDGIRNHPSYTLGYIVLANCYFDVQNFELAYNTIRPFVAKNLENITLQKLFAKTCINLGHLEEALQTFKYLLLLNPRDSYVADQVKILEDDLLIDQEEEPSERVLSETADFSEDDWVQVNFNNKEPEEKVEESLSDWTMNDQSPLDKFKSEIAQDKIKLAEHKLDDSFYFEDFDNHSEDVISNLDRETGKSSDSNSPIITHTLVDLYSSQGHTEKAIQILENILELHPSDKASIDKLANLKGSKVEDFLVDPKESENVRLREIYMNFKEKILARSGRVEG